MSKKCKQNFYDCIKSVLGKNKFDSPSCMRIKSSDLDTYRKYNLFKLKARRSQIKYDLLNLIYLKNIVSSFAKRNVKWVKISLENNTVQSRELVVNHSNISYMIIYNMFLLLKPMTCSVIYGSSSVVERSFSTSLPTYKPVQYRCILAGKKYCII